MLCQKVFGKSFVIEASVLSSSEMNPPMEARHWWWWLMILLRLTRLMNL